MEQKRDLLETVVSSYKNNKEVYKNVGAGVAGAILVPFVGAFIGAGIGVAGYQVWKNKDKLLGDNYKNK